MPRNSMPARRDNIRQAISGLAGGGKRRYPARLRSEIADYTRQRLETGANLTNISSELGVSHPTLVRLVAETKQRLRRVRVTEPVPATVSNPSLIVRGPGGVIVEGLDVDGVATLLRALL